MNKTNQKAETASLNGNAYVAEKWAGGTTAVKHLNRYF